MGEIGGIAQWSSDQRRKEAIRDSKGPSSPHFTLISCGLAWSIGRPLSCLNMALSYYYASGRLTALSDQITREGRRLTLSLLGKYE